VPRAQTGVLSLFRTIPRFVPTDSRSVCTPRPAIIARPQACIALSHWKNSSSTETFHPQPTQPLRRHQAGLESQKVPRSLRERMCFGSVRVYLAHEGLCGIEATYFTTPSAMRIVATLCFRRRQGSRSMVFWGRCQNIRDPWPTELTPMTH